MTYIQKVQSSMKDVPSVEVSKDTVYVRTDVKKIETEQFTGWEYNERQYNIKEYIEQLTQNEDTQAIAFIVSMLMSEMDFLRNRIEILEGAV